MPVITLRITDLALDWITSFLIYLLYDDCPFLRLKVCSSDCQTRLETQ